MTRDEYFIRIQQIFSEALNLSKSKSSDYSNEDPISNVRMVEQLGLCQTEIGIAARIIDKVSRMAQLLRKGQAAVKDESITDTLIDLINYAAMLMIVIGERDGAQRTSSTREIQLPPLPDL